MYVVQTPGLIVALCLCVCLGFCPQCNCCDSSKSLHLCAGVGRGARVCEIV